MAITTKRPWYMLVLARMGQRARCICAAEGLKDLGEGLRLTHMTKKERLIICGELDRMLQRDGEKYDQGGITYLKALLENIQEPLPWYVVAIDRMAIYAMIDGSMQLLTEAGEDLLASDISDAERGVIVANLDTIISSAAEKAKSASFKCLEVLRRQLVGKS